MKSALVAAAASVAMGGAAMAEELKLSYNVGVPATTSSAASATPTRTGQVFGGVDATYGIGYAGVWTSNVDFGTEPRPGIDVYAGVKPTVGDVSLDLGVLYYGYTKDKNGLRPGSFSYFEVKAAASTPFGPATLGAAVLLLAGIPGQGRRSPLRRRQRLGADRRKADPERRRGPSGHRRRLLRGVTTLRTWNAWASRRDHRHLTADVRYSDTDNTTSARSTATVAAIAEGRVLSLTA
jgi:hypothetical protein